MRWWKAKTRRMIQSSNKPEKPKNEVPSVESTGYFTGDFDHDLKLAKTAMENNSDVHFREFNLGRTGIRAAIVFVEMLADQDLIDKHIMKSLMDDFSKEYKVELSSLSSNVTDLIKKQILSISGVSEVNHVNEVVPEVLSGTAMLLIDGSAEVLLLGTVKRNTRNIEEPVSESLVRGARVGFTETIGTNTALLRQHGKNQNLSMVQFQVGKRAVKNLVVAYIKDIAEPGLVEEVKKRIEKIDIDDVLESGFVEQLIEDNYLSPFPQVQSTERLDRVMSALMEGRVAILLDGTPFVLIVPVTFSMLLQSPEDYYERWLPSSLIRIMRIGAAMISLLGPALYISFISFHPGLIPSELAISITGTRVGVPFPSLIEALIMEVAIEILREAGLRLPKPIGPAMGIVGGIIIGEAAVQAGIVSPIMVIVVAVTAISSFAIPQYSAGISLRMLRFVAMFCAATFGLYGVIMFFLMLASHAVKLKSFGVPYASPAVPYRLRDWKDFIVRMPIQMMKKRPKLLKTDDSTRQ
ncbi:MULTISPECIES: spore germination protein [Bacillus]|jgi:spore germination protein|uniref:spore germination protein n=1 Tax=Bacillus TaxID=1386 RepID=UPI0005CE952B|nr:spore germination protein [Bacillus licheniformis]KJE31603.1 GerA spore germination family protein [Bacillus licheniformis]MBA1161430.1 spore germination protein [Bacillus licheniformis]MED4340113.1 spore germination protein [Bacillus licheniformis]MED4370194.1 spore germination protein [Bacillus licheniformis]OAZ64854.1 putative membrane protein YndD [Bacillus licheniformis]